MENLLDEKNKTMQSRSCWSYPTLSDEKKGNHSLMFIRRTSMTKKNNQNMERDFFHGNTMEVYLYSK